MKRIIYLLLTCIATQVLLSQNTKTYNGKFENGIAIYQYTQVNEESEKVFDGAFKYTSYISEFGKTGLRKIETLYSGQFKNNLKDGKWTVIETTTYPKSPDVKQIKTCTGLFRDGKKHGDLNYSIKKMSGSKITNENQKIEVKNNVIVGNINIWDISGFIDSLGRYQGKWKIKADNIESVAEFENNVFKKLLVRNTEDGSIKFSYKTDSTLKFDSNTDFNRNLDAKSLKLKSAKEGLVLTNVIGEKHKANNMFTGLEEETVLYSGTEFYVFTMMFDNIKYMDNVFLEFKRGSEPLGIPYPEIIVQK